MIEPTDLLKWLHEKLTDAERTLSARKQEAEVWKTGTNKSWAAAAKLHPSTATQPPLSKAARMENAKRSERIKAKCQLDVEMFRTAITALASGKNDMTDVHYRHEWGMTLCGLDGWRSVWSTWDAETSLPSTLRRSKVTCLACRVRLKQGTTWDSFPSYLIDKCEGEIITEEFLQHALAAMMVDPEYSNGKRK